MAIHVGTIASHAQAGVGAGKSWNCSRILVPAQTLPVKARIPSCTVTSAACTVTAVQWAGVHVAARTGGPTVVMAQRSVAGIRIVERGAA